MNCEFCQKELEAHRLGSLPDNIRIQVETHLQECTKCTEVFKMLELAERVIHAEKELDSNPFLATRIMSRIEDLKKPVIPKTPVFARVAKPALFVILLAVVMGMGVLIGSMYRPVPDRGSLPVEMSMIDDATIESVVIFSNDQN